uniref:Neuromedin-B n=1 Tax=Fundulus heteroclitus TaxID=8078 RepID=A0A3Q2NRF6_FUNHE
MARLSRGGCLSSFILISYIAMTTSVTLDLTELKNKISQLKVNPRGNLWATGHFMGKKSVDSSFLETVFENIDAPSEDRGLYRELCRSLMEIGWSVFFFFFLYIYSVVFMS